MYIYIYVSGDYMNFTEILMLRDGIAEKIPGSKINLWTLSNWEANVIGKFHP